MNPVCHIYKSWPDDMRAMCTCGWSGGPHVFRRGAKRDVRRHCALRNHAIGDPLVVLVSDHKCHVHRLSANAFQVRCSCGSELKVRRSLRRARWDARWHRMATNHIASRRILRDC